MIHISSDRETAIARITEIVETVMGKNSLLQEKLDRDEMVEILSTLLDKVSPAEILATDEIELTGRIHRFLVREAVAGTLNDFTPEEMKVFDAAVARR